jgi:hypothetical protein
VRQLSVEGVVETKLRRDSSIVNIVGTDPGEIRTKRASEWRKSSERKINGRDSQSRIAKSR